MERYRSLTRGLNGYLSLVLGALTDDKVMHDPTMFRDVATRGAFEALGLLVNTPMLAVVEVLVWALARRATLLHERAASNVS